MFVINYLSNILMISAIPGWSKAQAELHCTCSLRQRPNALMWREWLLWKDSSDRRTRWEKVTDQSIRRKTKARPKDGVTCKSAAQIPGVHYHIFNWLAMSPAGGTCHEMLNKTWLTEEEYPDGRKVQLQMASQRMQMCNGLSGPDTCWLSGVRELVRNTIRCG